jgi:hypothetical protein
MAEKPLIYVVLGAPSSGRLELVQDLVQSGLDKTENALVLVSSKEYPLTAAQEETAPANLTTRTWDWDNGKLVLDVPEGFSRIFLITEGNLSPVDQVEAFAEWLPGHEVELGRIITVVHAQLASRHKELHRWHEACIHFSDVVLINRREDVPQKWLNEFLDHYKKEHYPCLFEQVKAGKVRNPALVLEPEPRRISLLFDELPELEPGEVEGEEEDDSESDPYLTRQRSGRREKQVPDINDYIE